MISRDPNSPDGEVLYYINPELDGDGPKLLDLLIADRERREAGQISDFQPGIDAPEEGKKR